jgi:hypothetical protein
MERDQPSGGVATKSAPFDTRYTRGALWAQDAKDCIPNKPEAISKGRFFGYAFINEMDATGYFFGVGEGVDGEGVAGSGVGMNSIGAVGVSVTEGLGEGLAVSVGVAVGVAVGVSVSVGVSVGVGAKVGVSEGVSVAGSSVIGVLVASADAVGTAVGAGGAAKGEQAISSRAMTRWQDNRITG